MLDLGPHASFIIAAYAVTALAVGALLFTTVEDDRRQRHKLTELERQGIRRRSAAKPATPAVRKAGAKPKSPAAATRKTARPRARKAPS